MPAKVRNTQNALMQGIAARLRALQADFHLSDQEMAERLDVSRSVWSGWVNARNMPNELAMILLCERTGVHMDWIYRAEGRYMPAALWLRLSARLKGIDPEKASEDQLTAIAREHFVTAAWRKGGWGPETLDFCN